MRILGIDPGLALVGYGIIEIEHAKPRAVDFGVIRTLPSQALSERLLTIHESLLQLLEQHAIDETAVEQLFFKKNVTTGIQVAHARGVILLALQRHALPLSEYGPHQVKQTLQSKRSTDKLGMQAGIQTLLQLDRRPEPDDAADALAVALCHWVRRAGS